jgi:hypothetical protein
MPGDRDAIFGDDFRGQVRNMGILSFKDFRTIRSVAEHGFQYPERDHSHLLACSFYTHRISASIACHSTPPVYVIEFSAY